MAPKVLPRKVITNEDRIKIECILDKEGFSRQHNNSEASKKIIKAFEDNGVLYLVTFDHRKTFKKEVVKFYLNVVVAGYGTIKSKVGDTEVVISAKDIREEFRLPKGSDLDVSSHNFNQKIFWDEIKSKTASAYVMFFGRRKVCSNSYRRELLASITSSWNARFQVWMKSIRRKSQHSMPLYPTTNAIGPNTSSTVWAPLC